ANPGDTELTLDDTKLQAFLADVGVVNDGTSTQAGQIGSPLADVDITTNTLGDLATALAGIEGITVPSSWAAGGTDAATTIEDFGLDKLAAAFSSMQEESPAVLATNRGLQDGDLVINGVTI